MVASKSEVWYLGRMQGAEHSITVSPMELFGRLVKIHSEATALARSHAKCGPWTQPKRLDSSSFHQLLQMQSLVSKHAEYMKGQAAKSGIDV
jgi:hypothetical protein